VTLWRYGKLDLVVIITFHLKQTFIKLYDGTGIFFILLQKLLIFLLFEKNYMEILKHYIS